MSNKTKKDFICSISLNSKHDILTVEGKFTSKKEIKEFINELKEYAKEFIGVDDK